MWVFLESGCNWCGWILEVDMIIVFFIIMISCSSENWVGC